MPTTAHASRRRYGRAYANRRSRTFAFAVKTASASPELSVAISVRVAAMPVPGGVDDLLQRGKARRPVQLGARLVGSGIQHRGIGLPARPERPRHFLPRHLLDGADDFLHGMRMTRAEI